MMVYNIFDAQNLLFICLQISPQIFAIVQNFTMYNLRNQQFCILLCELELVVMVLFTGNALEVEVLPGMVWCAYNTTKGVLYCIIAPNVCSAQYLVKLSMINFMNVSLSYQYYLNKSVLLVQRSPGGRSLRQSADISTLCLGLGYRFAMRECCGHYDGLFNQKLQKQVCLTLGCSSVALCLLIERKVMTYSYPKGT